MTNGRVDLVSPRRHHAAAWLTWRREALSVAHNPLLPLSEAEIADRLEKAGTDVTDRCHGEYRWIVEVDGRAVGTVSISGISWFMGYGEIGYQIGADHQGRGIGRQAVELVLEQAFVPGGLRRVMAVIAVDNVASRRLVEAVGFTQEGILRQHFVVGGVPVDEVVYGLLADEWISR